MLYYMTIMYFNILRFLEVPCTKIQQSDEITSEQEDNLLAGILEFQYFLLSLYTENDI